MSSQELRSATVSCDSSLPPSTSSNSILDSGCHIAHITTTATKQEKRTSVGLIDAARVRLSRDFRALVRSNSELHRVSSAYSVQAGDEDDRFVYLDYANNLGSVPADLDIVPMEVPPEERHRRFGTKIARFLHRSRSRSDGKKRRSRSLDDAVNRDATPMAGPSFPLHARHPSLEPEGRTTPVASSSDPKPATGPQSRPLSYSVAATNIPHRRAPQRVSKSQPGPLPATLKKPRPVDIHTEVVIVEQAAPSMPRKTKKMNLFGITISSPRKGAFGNSSKSKSRPSTPGGQPSGKAGEQALWPGRLRSNSSVTTQGDSKCTVEGEAPGDAQYHALPKLVAPQPRLAHLPYRPNSPLAWCEPVRAAEGIVTEKSVLGGRCSPLRIFSSSNVAGGAQGKGKGKERERARGARDRSDEKRLARETSIFADKAKAKDKDRTLIAYPRRAASPAQMGPEEASRSAAGVSPLEKVGSGSGHSRSSRGRDGSTSTHASGIPAVTRPKRIKHGSFDFERPASAGGAGAAAGSAHPVATNKIPAPAGRPYPLHRNTSARGPSRMHRAAESTQDVSKSKPALDVNTQILPLARRHTDRPSVSPPPARAQPTPLSHGHTAKTNYGTEPEPSTPNSSSHSGNSSSWGRSSGKRVARAAHPPFKFEPAVPPIPGSPASDERKRTMSNAESVKSASHAPLPLPPLPRKEARKGRSLDLGLGLNWAPSRIREDAVLRSVNSSGAIADAGLRTRARWRSISPIEDGSFGSSGDASDLAKAFHEVLGDAAYATFKNYVHRYDALAIPLDGHYGLMHHVQRLLDSAPGLDARRKQSLLDRFFRVVQANR